MSGLQSSLFWSFVALVVLGAIVTISILIAIFTEPAFFVIAPIALCLFAVGSSTTLRKAYLKALKDMYKKVNEKIAEINNSFQGRGVCWKLKSLNSVVERHGHTHIEIEISNPRDPTRGTPQIPMGFPPAEMSTHFSWLTPIASANKSFEENQATSVETPDRAPLLPPTKDGTITD